MLPMTCCAKAGRTKANVKAMTNASDVVFIFLFTTELIRTSFRSARRHRNVFRDLWRRVEIFPESKAPDQMTVDVVNIGEALTLTGRVIALCAVLETVDRKSSPVDLRNPERRVSCRGIRIRIAECPVNASY